MASKIVADSRCGVAAPDGVGGQTTLLIRNLPRRFTAWDLVAELTLYAQPASFDYVYVPWDRKGTNNIGYAFVNFVDASLAAQAEAAMEGRSWRTGSRSRPMKIQPADVQGLAENLERFVQQCGADTGHAPLVFSAGRPRSLESALALLRAAAAVAPPLQRESSCDDTSSTATTCSSCLVSPRGSASTASDTEDAEHWEEVAALSAPPGLEHLASAPPPGLEDATGMERRPWRPPPGLEDVVPVPTFDFRSSPSFVACREEMGALVQELLAAQMG